MNWAAVFIGGGLGSILRWLIFRCTIRFFPSIPTWFSTLTVNAMGCLVIGYLFAYVGAKSLSDNIKLFWFVGFLGGLTTFSTLGLNVFQLVQEKSFMYASLYFLVHGIVCISLVYAGYWIYSAR